MSEADIIAYCKDRGSVVAPDPRLELHKKIQSEIQEALRARGNLRERWAQNNPDPQDTGEEN